MHEHVETKQHATKCVNEEIKEKIGKYFKTNKN